MFKKILASIFEIVRNLLKNEKGKNEFHLLYLHEMIVLLRKISQGLSIVHPTKTFQRRPVDESAIIIIIGKGSYS